MPNIIKKPKKLVEIKAVEGEEFIRLSQIEHIYKVPDTYIGSDQQTLRECYFYDFDTHMAAPGTTTLPSGVERVFLEILSNAADNCLKSKKNGVNPGTIAVEMDNKTISIRNGGMPIPLRVNQVEQMWNPELIFGVLLTSSNYATDTERIGCGRNGYGAKLTNIYSKHFRVSVGDPERGLHYIQEWTDNMSVCSDPLIEEGYTGEAYVQVDYTLDFERFAYSEYPEEAFGLFARYVYDYSQNIHTPTSFNGLLFEPSKDPKDHGRFYFGDVPMITHYEWPPGTEVTIKRSGLQIPKDPTILPTSILILADTPREGACISFVNGMTTSEGGVHVDEAYKAVTKPLLDSINATIAGKDGKKDRKASLSWKDVKPHVSLLLVCHLPDPQFGGQMKEKLTKPKPGFHFKEKELAPIAKWEMVKQLLASIEAKIGKLLASTDGKNRAFIRPLKGEDANEAGKAGRMDCTLFIVEGDSAMSYAYHARDAIENGNDHIGIMPLKGKPINAMNASPLTLKDNKEIAELKKFLGIQEMVDYTIPQNLRKLRYGRLVILADADDDGKHIMGLILILFHCYYPSLLEMGYVSFLRTPLIRIRGRDPKAFYTEAEYKLWLQENPGLELGDVKYFKGLGSSNEEDVKVDMRDPLYVRYAYGTDEDKESLSLAFDVRRADDRKRWLREWGYSLEELDIGRQEDLQVGEFIEKEFIQYCKTNVRRSVPALLDGLKDSQRKILWSAYLIWGNKKEKKAKKTGVLSAYIVEHMGYRHGDGSLYKTMVGMTQTYVGSNNMNYLVPDGMFGTRMKGGKDAASSRYTATYLEWWFPYIFPKDDMPLLEFREEDGMKIEPLTLLPIIPMCLVNGARGIGTGHSTFIPNYNPLDVVTWYKAKLRGEPLPRLSPWYNGFEGELELKITKGGKGEELRNPEEGEEAEETLPEHPSLTLVSKGKYHFSRNETVITELPLGLWTNTYISWLTDLTAEKKIKGYTHHSKTNLVNFRIKGFPEASHKNLRLIRSYSLGNMVLLSEDDRPFKYNSVAAILEEFYKQRLPYFSQRKELVIQEIKDKIYKLDAKARFIEAIKAKKIDLNATNEVIDGILGDLQIPTFVRDIKTRSLAQQGTEKIYESINKLQEELDAYSLVSPEDLWLSDLETFETVWKRKGQGKRVVVRGKK